MSAKKLEMVVVQVLLSLLIPLLLLFFFYAYLSNGSSKKLNRPPSPPKRLITGHIHLLGDVPHRTFRDLARKHGPVMHLQLGRVSAVVISSVDAAREAMKVQDIVFANRPELMIAGPLFYKDKTITFAPYGEAWRQGRKLGMHILSVKQVHYFSSLRRERVEAMINAVEARAAAGTVDMSNEISYFTNDITSRAVLGSKYFDDGCKNHFLDLLKEMSKLFGGFYMGDFLPELRFLTYITGTAARIRSCSKKLDAFLTQIIDDHHARTLGAHDQPDMVDILLSLRHDDPTTTNNILDDEWTKGIILELFSAGTDSISLIMEWAMSELLRSPNKLRKLQDEIQKLGNGKQLVEDETIADATYLKAVIKEVLRLHPAAPLIERQCRQDTKLLGYDVTAKTRVMINVWAIGRDPLWWDSPEEFCPERFLDSNLDFKGQQFHYIPFGAGRRICPGTPFAISIIEMALANLMLRFSWKLPEASESNKGLDMDEAAGVTCHRKTPLLALVKPLPT